MVLLSQGRKLPIHVFKTETIISIKIEMIVQIKLISNCSPYCEKDLNFISRQASDKVLPSTV
jgi:hypothetical protein